MSSTNPFLSQTQTQTQQARSTYSTNSSGSSASITLQVDSKNPFFGAGSSGLESTLVLDNSTTDENEAVAEAMFHDAEDEIEEKHAIDVQTGSSTANGGKTGDDAITAATSGSFYI